jgi:hypothetical protein
MVYSIIKNLITTIGLVSAVVQAAPQPPLTPAAHQLVDLSYLSGINLGTQDASSFHLYPTCQTLLTSLVYLAMG